MLHTRFMAELSCKLEFGFGNPIQPNRMFRQNLIRTRLVGNLRPIVNRPAEAFEKSTTGRFPIGRRMPSCPTNKGMELGWKKSSRAAKILMFSNADDRFLRLRHSWIGRPQTTIACTTFPTNKADPPPQYSSSSEPESRDSN